MMLLGMPEYVRLMMVEVRMVKVLQEREGMVRVLELERWREWQL